METLKTNTQENKKQTNRMCSSENEARTNARTHTYTHNVIKFTHQNTHTKFRRHIYVIFTTRTNPLKEHRHHHKIHEHS